MDQVNNTETSKNSKKCKKDKKNIFLIILIFLNLFLMVLVAFGVYKIQNITKDTENQAYQLNNSLINKNTKMISQLNIKIDNLYDKIQKKDNYIKNARANINTVLDSYKTEIVSLTQQLESTRKSYLIPQRKLEEQKNIVNKNGALLEVELAKGYFQLTGNYKSSIEFLKRAISYLSLLSTNSSNGIYELRNTILILNKESNLKNIDKRSKNLSELITQISKLALLSPEHRAAIKEKKVVEQQKNTIFEIGMEKIKNLVSIENFDQINQVLLNKQARERVKYLVTLYLMQAKFAMQQNYLELSNQNISKAKGLVRKYFEKNNEWRQWMILSDQIISANTYTSINFNNLIELIKNIDTSLDGKEKI